MDITFVIFHPHPYNAFEIKLFEDVAKYPIPGIRRRYTLFIWKMYNACHEATANGGLLPNAVKIHSAWLTHCPWEISMQF